MKDVTIVVGTVGQSIMRSEDNGNTWVRVGPSADLLTRRLFVVSR